MQNDFCFIILIFSNSQFHAISYFTLYCFIIINTLKMIVVNTDVDYIVKKDSRGPLTSFTTSNSEMVLTASSYYLYFLPEKFDWII